MRTIPALLLASGLMLAAAPASAEEAKKPAAASGKTMLRLEVKPASEIFVDGKSRGKAELLELEVKPGLHIVRFVHSSGDEHENQLDAVAKKTTTYQWAFDYAEPTPAAEKKEEPSLVQP